MASTMLIRCGQRWRSEDPAGVVRIIDDRIHEGRVVEERDLLVKFEGAMGPGDWITEEALLRASWAFVEGPTDPETPEERRARVLAIEEANVPKRASQEAWARVVRSFPMSASVSQFDRDGIATLRLYLALYLEVVEQFRGEGGAGS